MSELILRRRIAKIKWAKPTPIVFVLVGAIVTVVSEAGTMVDNLANVGHWWNVAIAVGIATIIIVIFWVILHLWQRRLEEELEKFVVTPEEIVPQKFPYTS